MSTQYEWTHPSVVALQREAEGRDPVEEIVDRAERVTLAAMEEGWRGPPFDPFELADHLGVEVVAREDLSDARLVSADSSRRIEFNPHRRPARVRFSLAHEIAHLLFNDYADQVRYRNPAPDHEARPDDWQLEMLCNVAAAELLMPAGAFPDAHLEQLSLPHLLNLRAHFQVSTEALLRRVVKLTDDATCLFAAARTPEGFRLDYLVPSRAWGLDIPTGASLPADTVLARCTAVGYSDHAVEDWGGGQVTVQAVGIPPYPGARFPRIVGLLTPAESQSITNRLLYVRGDATEPRIDGPTVIAHVVNDRARRWSPRGFAGALMRRFDEAGELYRQWATGSGELGLGAVHLDQVGENLWIASLVAQAGYGETETGRPRLRVRALRDALERLAELTIDLGASVHMPLMGTGQAGGTWPVVRDLVLAELVDRAIPVTVYVLPEHPMPDEHADSQLSLV